MAHTVLTIGRQFGSGGHEIGDRLSRSLGIPLYDRNLVEMAAEKLGLSEISVEEVDESVLNTFLSAYRYPDHFNAFTGYGLPLNDSTYLAQSTIIESLAKRGPCIIIGRCGDFVLRQNPDCLNLFICASMEDRIKRIAQRYDLSERKAADKIKRIDRERKSYYEFHTGSDWGSIEAHQMLLNVSKLGVEGTVDVLEAICRRKMKE